MSKAPVAPNEASMLRNLLARIHGDGGHYLDAHGLEKALKNADSLVAGWRAAIPQQPVAWTAAQPLTDADKIAFARAILAEGQMEAYAEGRKDALEAAAKACDDIEEKPWFGYENPNTFQDAKWKCEAAIRAIDGGSPTASDVIHHPRLMGVK